MLISGYLSTLTPTHEIYEKKNCTQSTLRGQFLNNLFPSFIVFFSSFFINIHIIYFKAKYIYIIFCQNSWIMSYHSDDHSHNHSHSVNNEQTETIYNPKAKFPKTSRFFNNSSLPDLKTLKLLGKTKRSYSMVN